MNEKNINCVAIIGLEIHTRLKTKTKMFCSCSNDFFESLPNENICPVCTGFPGVLPVLNENVFKIGLKIGNALKCKILKKTRFDRKNYFYPDLPYGYQISQFLFPICEGGKLRIFINDDFKEFELERVHIENDTGKNVHKGNKSFINYNRAGSPLAEIVTKPCFETSEDVVAFLRELRAVLRYISASDADMEKGMLRCDVNINIKFEENGKEKRTEIVELKNMNSFSSIKRAIEYEVSRQNKLIRKGEANKIVHETRGWNEKLQQTKTQRAKEESHDYRYFPEPDIFTINHEIVEDFDKLEYPSEKIEKFIKKFGLEFDDALKICDDLILAEFYEKTVKLSKNPKKVKSLILSSLIKFLDDDGINIADCKVKEKDIMEIINMTENNEISMTSAKLVLKKLYDDGGDILKLVEKMNIKQMSDDGEMEKICDKIISENKEIVDSILDGKDRAYGALMGKIMKETGGKANPKIMMKILKSKIKK